MLLVVFSMSVHPASASYPHLSIHWIFWFSPQDPHSRSCHKTAVLIVYTGSGFMIFLSIICITYRCSHLAKTNYHEEDNDDNRRHTFDTDVRGCFFYLNITLLLLLFVAPQWPSLVFHFPNPGALQAM